MYFLVKLLVNALSLFLVVQLIPGLHIAGWKTVFLAAIGLGFVNAVIRPVVMVLTLPFNIVTLGLLTFVINALLFYSVSVFVPGFTVASFSAAFFGSLLYSLISSVLSFIVAPGRAKAGFFSVHAAGGGRKHYPDAIDVEGKSEKHENCQ
jgi:putative membrane protein